MEVASETHVAEADVIVDLGMFKCSPPPCRVASSHLKCGTSSFLKLHFKHRNRSKVPFWEPDTIQMVSIPDDEKKTCWFCVLCVDT